MAPSQTFADVVAEHVLTALANGLSLGRIHHAYSLFPARAASVKPLSPDRWRRLNPRNRHTATPRGVGDNRREN